MKCLGGNCWAGGRALVGVCPLLGVKRSQINGAERCVGVSCNRTLVTIKAEDGPEARDRTT